MSWIGIGISGLTWLLLFSVNAWAHTASVAGMHASPLQAESVQQHSAADMKPFGDSYDSDAALKTSQATIGRTLDGYQFRNRQGRTVSMADYRGKPLLISMIYTSCYHICPTTTKNLARAVETVRSAVGEDSFRVVTIGFDALHDTPERMRGYANQQGVNSERNWTFLSADKAAITRLSADLGFLYTPSSTGFDHLIQTTVVDGDGKIYRQIYGMEVDPALLTEAMKELVFGLSPATLNLSSLVSRVRLFCTTYDPSTGTYKLNYAMIFGMVIGVLVATATGIVLVRFLRDA